MILHRAFIGRALVLAAMVTLLIAVTAGAAGASSEGAELRRIDTSNVNKTTDIKAVVDHGRMEEGVNDEHGSETAVDDHGAAPGDSDEEESSGNVEENDSHAAAPGDEGEHGGEEAHPKWMITGWQSIFTVLAVIYFGLGVTLLPFIMAKEEH